MLGNLLFELYIISRKQRHIVEADVSTSSHLDPVAVLGGGDLLAHAGPGQHHPRHQAAQPRQAQPGQAGPGVCIQQREGVVILTS